MARPKTVQEISFIQEVQGAADAAMSAVISYLKNAEAPTAEAAHILIDTVLSKYDCDSPKDHIVAPGVQAVEPHERGHGPIRPGEAVVIDIFPRSKKTGYWGDMTRTVCIGNASPELKHMFDTVLEAQEKSLAMIRPGVLCKDVHAVAADHFAAQGFETSGKGKEFSFAEGFVHALGHGVGADIHEEPRISPKSTDVLMVGDVITVEPGLYYRDVGGIRIEDLVVVTEDGFRNLTKTEKVFVI